MGAETGKQNWLALFCFPYGPEGRFFHFFLRILRKYAEVSFDLLGGRAGGRNYPQDLNSADTVYTLVHQSFLEQKEFTMGMLNCPQQQI